MPAIITESREEESKGSNQHSFVVSRVNTEGREDLYNSVVRRKHRDRHSRVNTATDEATIEEDDTLEEDMENTASQVREDDVLAQSLRRQRLTIEQSMEASADHSRSGVLGGGSGVSERQPGETTDREMLGTDEHELD